jgi:hypothetical protein
MRDHSRLCPVLEDLERKSEVRAAVLREQPECPAKNIDTRYIRRAAAEGKR